MIQFAKEEARSSGVEGHSSPNRTVFRRGEAKAHPGAGKALRRWLVRGRDIRPELWDRRPLQEGLSARGEEGSQFSTIF